MARPFGNRAADLMRKQGWEVDMLDGSERDMLRQIERRLAAADPDLAHRMRDGQRRLPRTRTQVILHVVIVLLMLLAVILVVLGMLANAVALVAVATCLWGSRRWRIICQDT
jgi:Flp pilus assembly protein TadB